MATALILRGNSLCLPLADESVDLIVTSPPYWGLRSYRDSGEHFDEQIGSEPTPQDWLEALWAVMAECWRVLKPTGSCWVNLGDKRGGSGGHNNAGLSGKPIPAPPGKALGAGGHGATRRNAPDRYNQAAIGRTKSKMLLPHRFAIGCMEGRADPDGIGWIMRQDHAWHKLNALPESVRDRCRDSHEYLFHLTKSGHYFSAIDEIREPYDPNTHAAGPNGAMSRPGPLAPTWGLNGSQSIPTGCGRTEPNPLGKAPGSVWSLPSEPLRTPDHFCIFPDQLPWALFDERPKKAQGSKVVGMFDDEEPPGVATTWGTSMRVIAAEVMRRYREGLPGFTVTSIDHFAAFPSELPRRVILGWSPAGICVECGQGRVPVLDRAGRLGGDNNPNSRDGTLARSGMAGDSAEWAKRMEHPDSIIGYACACTPSTYHPEHAVPSISVTNRMRVNDKPQRERLTTGAAHGAWPVREPKTDYDLDAWVPPPTRPAVVLDPFAGTGTTVMVARALGRIGIGVDLSMDYCRLGRWRVFDSGGGAKATRRTNEARQGSLVLESTEAVS